MTSRNLRLMAAPPLVLLLLGGAWLLFSPAKAEAFKDNNRSETMEQYLTSVTKDVDAYWTQEFKDSGLPEPRVSYDWIPAGQTSSSACGQLGDDAAAYCPEDDTIHVSQAFATEIYDGALNQALPGSSQGYGQAVGDFAVAYIVAHEYGHQVQAELGAFEKYGNQVPTMAFELQADCYAGTWAKHAQDQNKLEDGDVQEALDAALAVGDFSTDSPGHHGTPEQREAAWKTGFDAGDPSSCSTYLDGSTATDDSGSAQPQQDPGYPQQDPGYPQQDPGYPQQDQGYPQGDSGDGSSQQDPGAAPYGLVGRS